MSVVEQDAERSAAEARLDSVWSVIFHIWEDEPVFHGVRYRRTLCGREIGLYTPSLPMKHARAFGRPCRSCWPIR